MASKESRFYIQSEVSSAGKTITLSTGWNINPDISDSDAVAVGNAFGEFVSYAPTGFKRVDTFQFAPDEFDSLSGG